MCGRFQLVEMPDLSASEDNNVTMDDARDITPFRPELQGRFRDTYTTPGGEVWVRHADAVAAIDLVHERGLRLLGMEEFVVGTDTASGVPDEWRELDRDPFVTRPLWRSGLRGPDCRCPMLEWAHGCGGDRRHGER